MGADRPNGEWEWQRGLEGEMRKEHVREKIKGYEKIWERRAARRIARATGKLAVPATGSDLDTKKGKEDVDE